MAQAKLTGSGERAGIKVWTPAAQRAAAGSLLFGTFLLGISLAGPTEWIGDPESVPKHGSLGAKLEINSADRAGLLQLPGVGESLADRMEAYRRDHGPFQRIDDLRGVRGIGPATMERLRPWIYVEGDTTGNSASNQPVASRKPTKLRKGVVDLNKAGKEELMTVPGIGPVTAERILEARKRQPFQTVDDLRRVPGLGGKTFERIQAFVTVSTPIDPSDGDE